jgi:tRNA A-37 threonylcarbamoyl transferase component Bud32
LLEDLSVWPRVSDITSDDPGAATLSGQLTKLIIDLHRNQVIHGDLQSIHIYLKGQAKGASAALIDLEGVRFTRALQDQDRIQMLAQLNASISEDVISTHERIHMMERYLNALPFEHGNERALKQVVTLSRARDQHWKGPSA